MTPVIAGYGAHGRRLLVRRKKLHEPAQGSSRKPGTDGRRAPVPTVAWAASLRYDAALVSRQWVIENYESSRIEWPRPFGGG
jgi:hypothetical protein